VNIGGVAEVVGLWQLDGKLGRYCGLMEMRTEAAMGPCFCELRQGVRVCNWGSEKVV